MVQTTWCPKRCTLMRMYASGMIVNGVLNTLNVQVSTGVPYTHTSNPLWGHFTAMCTRCACGAKTLPTMGPPPPPPDGPCSGSGGKSAKTRGRSVWRSPCLHSTHTTEHMLPTQTNTPQNTIVQSIYPHVHNPGTTQLLA